MRDLLLEFAGRIGPVQIELRRERPACLQHDVNAVNREAITMVEQGMASIEDVDPPWCV